MMYESSSFLYPTSVNYCLFLLRNTDNDPIAQSSALLWDVSTLQLILIITIAHKIFFCLVRFFDLCTGVKGNEPWNEPKMDVKLA